MASKPPFPPHSGGHLPVLRLEEVTKTYQMGAVSVQALRGISLTVRRGERVSIIGPSGSGKSTLLHILGLLDKPSTGRVLVEGTDTGTLGDEGLSRFRGLEIGFIFQAFHLVPALSALGNVMLPMMLYDTPLSEREERAHRALDRLGLGDRAHHLPSELSGGQRQRVAIARSLVNDPAILLADEPTGNLDSSSGEEVMGIFDSLHKEGRTLIVVTHDPGVARRSPRVVSIRDGQVEFDGGPERLVPHAPVAHPMKKEASPSGSRAHARASRS
ncbi:putative ABC transporter ATP-binding protein [uncultured archaeon]|nr:putative ABC transporter ATP-binding protein [uncultured archaeon]